MKLFRPPIRKPRKPQRSSSAVKVGEVFEAPVLDLTSAGFGVVEHTSGMRLFVAGTWPGEQVRVRVTDLKNRWGSAELIELVTASGARVQPPCPHHGFKPHQCGGCPWMFVDQAAQSQAKQERVSRAVMRLGAEAALQPIWAAPEALGYRSRAQLKTDGRELGFIQSQSNRLAPVEDCLVLTEKNRQTLKSLRAQLPQPAWRPRRGKTWSTLDLDESTAVDQVQLNTRLPFHQANPAQNQRMRAWITETLAQLPQPLATLELFAGSGNFTEVLSAAGCAPIIAVEVVEVALASLEEKALPGVQTVACDLFAPDQFRQLLARYSETNLLVLDPPRDGLPHAQELLSQPNNIQDILYISCDLATFERDVAHWCAGDFRLCQVQPLDLFPQTPHVEILAHLKRVKA